LTYLSRFQDPFVIFEKLLGTFHYHNNGFTTAGQYSTMACSISAPEHQPGSMTREEVLKLMKEVSSVAKQDFVLIDLRRNDHEVSLALLPFGIYHVRSQCR
jgi:hypothetical protein